MEKHKYWGKVEEDWAGFSAGIKFESQYFDNNCVTIFLGEEYDEEGEEIEIRPSNNELNDFKKTYIEFKNNLDKIIDKIMDKTFERYLKLYAHYYESEKKSGKKALNISTKQKHFEYIKDITTIRKLQIQNSLRIPYFWFANFKYILWDSTSALKIQILHYFAKF